MFISFFSNKKTNFYLFCSLISIIGIISVFIIKDVTSKKTQITNRIQKQIITNENDANKILSLLITELRSTPKSESYFTISNTFNLGTRKETYLIFEKNSLVFWSNNRIPVYDNYQNNLFTSGLNFLENGYYDLRKLSNEEITLIALIPIKYNYTFDNEFLKHEFADFLHLNSNVDLTLEKNQNEIYNQEGDFLFSLNFPDDFNLSDLQMFLVILFYLFAFSFIIAAIYHVYKVIMPASKYKTLRLAGFIFDLIVLRLLTFFLRYPKAMFESDFFSPEYYASSIWIPSLGDLFLNVLTFFAIAHVIYRGTRNIILNWHFSGYKFFVFTTVALLFVFTIYSLMIGVIQSLVFNSGISFNLNDISGIDQYSLVGFIIIGLILLSFVFLTYAIIAKLFLQSKRKPLHYLFAIFTFVFLYLLYIKTFHYAPVSYIFLLIYLIYFSIEKNISIDSFSVSNALVLIILFSVFTTYLLYQSNLTREHEIREILARNLTEQRDPIAEFKFAENQKVIAKDSTLVTLLDNYPFPEIADLEKTTDYLIRTYFSNFWSKYDVLVTICDTGRILNIRPDDVTVNCDIYFEENISTFGKKTSVENFYFIDLELNDDYYLGKIPINTIKGLLNIYVEFYSKSAPKSLGYPELLKDFKKENEVNWSVYSYARYENNELFFRLGKYFYSMDLESYNINLDQSKFFDINGYNHYYYPIDNAAALIISIKNPGFLEITAPFSYISIFFGILVYIIFLLFKGGIRFNLAILGFKQRIQFIITLLIIVSFFMVGVSSSFFIINLNNKKNNAILSEKAHSVLVELEHKLSGEEKLPPEMEMYLSDLLYKFSIVFFTDINLYDLNGTLLATSRAEIFNRGLISTKMNTEAFLNLNNTKKSLYIHDEEIGDYPFLSAYLPLRNYNNDLIAYINLPYFAKQDELTNEISSFLVAFINIYVILIAISIYMALFVSNYISKPLQLLKEKLSTLKLGEKQQKINWQKDDEIGSLVEEYNRMVDELAESAELLAKSERESAWREMAKQIAHEIKNPLTPMKLSVQYLEKAWKDKSPDWEERLHRFSQTLIEQIESLSVIATAFSDFANMPKSKFTRIDIDEIAKTAIDLFKDTSAVNIELHSTGPHYISGDKEQFLRVFNNLIKNSIQAIKNEESGLIKVHLQEAVNHQIIKVLDNGQGIPEDQKDKVFYPNFTTKSGGTGLGLALVKNIIVNAGGEIDFESSTEGTTFIITLPKYSYDESIDEE